jgi:hypothetical protein
MVPNLTASQREQIRDMIRSKSLTIAQMADVASCGKRSIKSRRSYLHLFGTTEASSNGVGRPRHITPPMLEALREYLTERLDQYLDRMAVSPLDEFGAL